MISHHLCCVYTHTAFIPDQIICVKLHCRLAFYGHFYELLTEDICANPIVLYYTKVL